MKQFRYPVFMWFAYWCNWELLMFVVLSYWMSLCNLSIHTLVLNHFSTQHSDGTLFSSVTGFTASNLISFVVVLFFFLTEKPLALLSVCFLIGAVIVQHFLPKHLKFTYIFHRMPFDSSQITDMDLLHPPVGCPSVKCLQTFTSRHPNEQHHRFRKSFSHYVKALSVFMWMHLTLHLKTCVPGFMCAPRCTCVGVCAWDHFEPRLSDSWQEVRVSSSWS